MQPSGEQHRRHAEDARPVDELEEDVDERDAEAKKTSDSKSDLNGARPTCDPAWAIRPGVQDEGGNHEGGRGPADNARVDRQAAA